MICGYSSFFWSAKINLLWWFSFVFYCSVTYLTGYISVHKLATLRSFCGSRSHMGRGCWVRKNDLCKVQLFYCHSWPVLQVTWRQNLVEWIAEDLVFLACAIKFTDLLISWLFYFHFCCKFCLSWQFMIPFLNYCIYLYLFTTWCW